MSASDEAEHRPTPQRETIRTQYTEIGKALMVCEASAFSIGIPWLPPTKEVRALSAEFDPPACDYIRYALVTVSTKVLESYCDDLETSQPDSESARMLHLRIPTVVERYAFTVAATGASLALSLTAATVVGFPQTPTLVFALLVAAVCAAAASFVCTERQRRATFHFLLNNELLRRRGLDQPTAKRVKLLPVDVEPLSE